MRVGNSAELSQLKVGGSPAQYVAIGANFDRGLFTYDDESVNYFNRAGVGLNDTDSRLKLNAFITGLKNSGLWNNLYCFPLSSKQNPLLKPLGGLINPYSSEDRIGGANPYTPIIGATHNADGINFSGLNSRLVRFDTLGATGESSFTMMVVGRTDNVSPSSVGALLSSANNSYQILQPTGNATAVAISKNQTVIFTATGVFLNTTGHFLLWFTWDAGGATRVGYNNVQSAASGSVFQPIGSNSFCIGSQGTSSPAPTSISPFEGTISFVGLTNSYTSLQQQGTFYNILRNTILNGLLV